MVVLGAGGVSEGKFEMDAIMYWSDEYFILAAT